MDSTQLVKIFTGRLIITVEDDYHEVELYRKDKKLKKGYGYIHNNYVYVYRGKKEKVKTTELEPGIYLGTRGEHVFIHPETHKERSMYTVDNVIEMDINRIFEEIAEQRENFIDPNDVEVINNNRESFRTTIKEEDDFLKYIVKKAINDKEINLKNYRHKFQNQYALNNMKAGLQKETKMTVTNFRMWCEVLGLKWTLTVENDETDRLNPLPEPLVIKSEDF